MTGVSECSQSSGRSNYWRELNQKPELTAQETYISESCQSLKARANQHRKPCSNEAQNPAVYTPQGHMCHAFNTEDVVILDKEERNQLKEAI